MGKNSKQQSAEQMRELRERLAREEQEKKKKQNRMILIVGVTLLAVVLVAVGIGVLVTALSPKENVGGTGEPVTPEVDSMNNVVFRETDQVTEYVKFTVAYKDKNGNDAQGEIVIRLRADVAPATVKNFQELVGKNFYQNLTFHRVYSGFMIQGGDPKGDGSGGSGTPIKGEFASNGYPNGLSHLRGVISMARSSSRSAADNYGYDSASSQFFIMHQDSTFLDGDYAAFGYVVKGMATVDGIAETEVEYGSAVDNVPTSPVNPVTIIGAVFVQPENA